MSMGVCCFSMRAGNALGMRKNKVWASDASHPHGGRRHQGNGRWGPKTARQVPKSSMREVGDQGKKRGDLSGKKLRGSTFIWKWKKKSGHGSEHEVMLAPPPDLYNEVLGERRALAPLRKGKEEHSLHG